MNNLPRVVTRQRGSWAQTRNQCMVTRLSSHPNYFEYTWSFLTAVNGPSSFSKSSNTETVVTANVGQLWPSTANDGATLVNVVDGRGENATLIVICSCPVMPLLTYILIAL